MNIDLFLEIEDLALLEAQIKLIRLRKQLLEKLPDSPIIKREIKEAEQNLIRFLRDLLNKPNPGNNFPNNN